MTDLSADRLVADYLHRLEVAAAPLPSTRRAELVAEIRTHIDDALRAAGRTDDITVREILERLGSPEEIAAAAFGSAPGASRTSDRFATVGVIVLGLGFVVPVIGWLVGAASVLVSDAWSAREKVIGLALSLPIALVLAGAILALNPEGTLGGLEIAVLIWGFAGIFSAVYLWRRLSTAQALVAA